MKFLLFLLPAALYAQNAAVDRGVRLYRTQCAVPYCHGPDGTAGRAPQLIGHSQSINSIFKIITWGIPGTGMPEFTTRLKSEEIADLVAYVMTLRGASPAPATAAPAPGLASEAKEGRALFFDAARLPSCGTCHEMDGWGAPVGPGISTGTNLRAVPTIRVKTARPTGEAPFPAVLVEQSETRVRVYDLTGPLPVLRTFPTAQIKLDAMSTWRHEDATRRYTDSDLEKIDRFIKR